MRTSRIAQTRGASPLRSATEPAGTPEQSGQRQPAHGSQESSSSGGHTAPVSFMCYCNGSWADVLCTTVYTSLALKWGLQMAAPFFISYAAFLMLCALRWWGAIRWPEGYLRWREVLVAGASVTVLTLPIPPHIIVEVTQALPELASSTTRPLLRRAVSPLLGLGVLLCTSGAYRLTGLSLGYRLRLPAHLFLHIALLVWALAHVGSSCQVIASGLRPGQALPGSRGLFKMFSCLLMALGAPVVVPLRCSPETQCQCLMAMLQAAAFLLPAALHVMREARVYSEYRRANPGGRASTEVMHRFYLGSARALDLMPPDVQLSMVVLALSAVWFAILAAILP